MKILLTGACGYIGSVLTGYLLEAGHEVYGLDNLMYKNGGAVLPYLGHPRFSFVRGDVRDRELLAELVRPSDVVIPLAALVGAPFCEKHLELAWDVNYESILALTKMIGWRKLIYFNTNSGYFKGGETPCKEEDPLKPGSIYGKSKVAAEDAVLASGDHTVLRLATVFGSSPRQRMDLLVNDFTERVVRDGALTIYEPHFRRNFVHVRDVSRAVLHVLENDLRGVYNLGNPDANLTKLALARKICHEIDPFATVTEEEGKDPDQRDYLVSNEKLLATGFEFRHDLPGGVREMASVVRMFPREETARMRNV